jgi:acetyl-CoA carboxylase biotin carboxyl carrier protein
MPAAASAAAVIDDKSHVVTSPFVGTFYRKPNPDSPTYVSLNDKVDKGQVLCIVEAMKLMNEIEADVAGTVIGILVEDGAPVEYGQPLFKIAT